MELHKRIALVFDFDDTLGPDSTSSFLAHIGIEPHTFWERHLRLVTSGWDPIPAYLQMMILESQKRPKSKRITRLKLQKFGQQLTSQPGLATFFSRMKKFVASRDKNAELYFFVISSGIGDIIRHFPYASKFQQMWSSNFAFAKNGEIEGIKNVVSFTDKTRYLFQIQKGIYGPGSESDPFAVNRRVPLNEVFIPFNSMVMIGDGFTDVPCFSLLEKNGGRAIGVYEREAADRWGRAWGLMSEQRVQHMVAADFRPHRGLDDALCLALGNMLIAR